MKGIKHMTDGHTAMDLEETLRGVEFTQRWTKMRRLDCDRIFIGFEIQLPRGLGYEILATSDE